jgi:eukaryotic-like serine/threonine-protein kinase
MRAAESRPIPSLDRERRPIVTFGPFAFDTHTRLLTRDGHELALPPRVLGVLELLLERAGDVVPRQDLIDTVWKDAFVTDTSLAEAVSVLRQALGDDPQSPTYIQTRHRRGYRFVAPVLSSGSRVISVAEYPTPTPPSSRVSPSIGGQLVPWSAAVLCALIAVVATWRLTHREGQTVPSARFMVSPVPGTRFDASAPALAISPDGAALAWSACDNSTCRLFVRPLDRLEASPLPGSDGAHAPFFSPDGKWIAFFADGRLKKVAIAGGAPVTLADAATPLGGAWLDRVIVFAGSSSGGLMRVPPDGGEAQPLTIPREPDGEVRHAWPSLVPGTRLLLFSIDTTAVDDAPGVLGVLSLDDGDARSQRWRTLVAGSGLARAASSDTIVFSRGQELYAISFDALRLETAGVPRAILSPLASARGLAQYALSPTGSLAYATSPSEAIFGLSWWSAAAGDTDAGEIRDLRNASLAPDGTRLAGVRAEGGRTDVWVADVRRGATTRLTHTGINSAPVWSADSRTVFFASRTDRSFAIWRRDADATQPATRLVGSSRHALPLAASPDGQSLAFLQTADATRADIWLLPLATGQPRALVEGPFDEGSASFSPNSALLAFESAETGRWEIYVQRLHDGKRLVVSTDGGESPVWTKDGLYYQSRGRLMRAAISDAGGELRVIHFAPLPIQPNGSLRGVSSDGRLLFDRPSDLSQSAVVVSLDWMREVRSLLGPPAAALPR